MNTSIDLTTLSVLLAILLAAAALAWVGLRGRRVGDHPTCRRCGFDLFGAPPDADRCPECGADVRDGRNVAVGRRQRRAWPFVVAATLAIVATLGLVGVGFRVDWRGRLPTWYVLREARTGSAASRVVPIDQLLARDAAAALPADQRVTLARAVLALQRDPSNVWKPAWGDWAAQRAIDRTLPPAEADAFWQGLVANTVVTVRQTIRRGDAPAVRIASDGRRGGLSTASPIRGRMSTRDRTLTIDGVADAGGERGYVTSYLDFSSGRSSLGTSESAPMWRSLPPGAHAVEWACPVRVYAGTPPQDERDGAPGPPEVARMTVAFRGTVTVVDGDDVRLVRDPSVADAIRGAITDAKLRVPTRSHYSTTLELNFDAMPVDVAFDVIAKQGDGPERKLTTIQRPTSASTGRHSIGMADVKLEPGVTDLIFRASADAARSTVDLFEVWEGEVRLTNVPVEREK